MRMASLLVWLAWSSLAQAASPWRASLQPRLVKGAPIVEVHQVAGSNTPAVWIDRWVDAPLKRVAAVVGACERYVGVIPRVQKVILHKKGVPNQVCELFLDMPFPFSDVRSTILYDGRISDREVVMTYRQVKGDYKIHQGGWYLRAVGDKTWVHYRLHVDLGKPLPKWLINSFTKGALKTTVANVAKRAGAP